MAHNINTYIGRKPAWHQLGTVTGEYLTWESILAHGGLDFHVFKSQLHDGLGRPVAAYGTFRWNHQDKARGDKAAAEFLGTVGQDYRVIQHSESFRTLDLLVEQTGGAHYETAGVLGNGEVVWGLVDLNLVTRVRGVDEHHNYLLGVTSHDGTYAHRYKVVTTRVVCNNTLDAALSERVQSQLVVRHTKNSQQRLDDMQEALAGIHAGAMTVENKLNLLAGRKMLRENLTAIMDRLFPKTAKEDAATGETRFETSTRRDNILAEILALYESNDGNAFPEFRGTGYNLLNAITEYTDHYRGSRGGDRAEAALFGSGNKLKSQALEVILAGTANAPAIPTRTYTDVPVAPANVPDSPMLTAILAEA